MTNQTEFAPGICEAGIMSRISTFIDHSAVFRERDIEANEAENFFDRCATSALCMSTLVGFIEDEFGVSVAPQDLRPENFGSLRSVARFVAANQPYAVG